MSSNELMGTLTRGFSTSVRMELIINEGAFPLSQIGPDRIKLKTAQPVPLGPAQIHLYVDNHLKTWPVRILPAAPEAKWIPIENIT